MAIQRAEPVCRVGATLGEGPAWVERDAALWFVDIKQHKLHRFDPPADRLDSWDAPAQIGWVLPSRGGGFVVGLQGRLASFDVRTGVFRTITEVEAHLPGNRLNDATTDADGRIWFGSMDDAEAEATGRLHVHDGQRLAVTGLAPAVITNGPAFSPDGRTLYHTDTLARIIHAVPVNDDATLGPARVFATIEAGAGHPDGLTVDSEGGVWTGLFGGWGVRRYTPDGRLAATVAFPTANVTKVAFGGPDLKTVYATTARKGLSAADLAAQPEAGHVFAFAANAPGLKLSEAASFDH